MNEHRDVSWAPVFYIDWWVRIAGYEGRLRLLAPALDRIHCVPTVWTEMRCCTASSIVRDFLGNGWYGLAGVRLRGGAYFWRLFICGCRVCLVHIQWIYIGRMSHSVWCWLGGAVLDGLLDGMLWWNDWRGPVGFVMLEWLTVLTKGYEELEAVCSFDGWFLGREACNRVHKDSNSFNRMFCWIVLIWKVAKGRNVWRYYVDRMISLWKLYCTVGQKRSPCHDMRPSRFFGYPFSRSSILSPL